MKIIAQSPICKPSEYTVRGCVVIREDEKEYVVHNAEADEDGKLVGFFWGHYFQKSQCDALDQAVVAFMEKLLTWHGLNQGFELARRPAEVEADEADEAPEPDGPEEGDLVTYDGCTTFYECGKHSAFEVRLGRNYAVRVEDGQDWKDAVRRHMDRQNVWPGIWSCSDHGNLTPLDPYAKD